MQKGYIKTFNDSGNFGFITPDGGGEDVHFNRRVVEGGAITQGAQVEFETGPGRKPGEVTAKRVTIIGPPLERSPSRVPGASPPRSSPATATVPQDCVFTSFYGDNGRLRKELFFAAPQTLADVFRSAGLKSSQYRQLYQAFLGFAGPLRDQRLAFEVAVERFGRFYVERIVRQTQRGMLPPVVKDFVDAHRELALKSPSEMLGLFEYVKNICCYFGESDKS